MARQPSHPDTPGESPSEAESAPAGEEVPTRRVALLVEYDGTDFAGFQVQRDQRTVAGALDETARRLGSPNPRVICAGRTDAGVHAAGQVVAVSLPLKLKESRLALALNANLPEDVRIREARVCHEFFDPRRDAIMRTYVYRICAGHAVPPTQRFCVAYLPRELDAEAARAATEAFLGQWEFEQWRASQCEANRTLLTISEARIVFPRHDANPLPVPWFEIVFSARSFLHHMVRFLVGGIVAASTGKMTVDELKSALAQGKRPACVVPAPACGLTLAKVGYPGERDPFAPPPPYVRPLPDVERGA